MAIAKRDAAKRGLYSRFFRGPVLGPETLAEEERRLTALVADAFRQKEAHVEGVRVIELTADKQAVVDPEVSKSSHKKRKTRDSEDVSGVEVGDDDKETRRERKRQRKKERLKKKEEESQEVTRAKKKEKKKVKDGITASQEVHAERSTWLTKRRKKTADESEDDEETKCRRRRREEKKRIKAFRKLEMKEMTATERPTSHPKNENPSKSKSKVAEELTHEVKKKKKKRKRSGSPEESE
jgi:nucleolar protein TMA23